MMLILFLFPLLLGGVRGGLPLLLSPPPLWRGQGWLSLMEGPGVAPGSWQGGGGKSEFDFPPVLYVDLPLYGMTYTLAVQVI